MQPSDFYGFLGGENCRVSPGFLASLRLTGDSPSPAFIIFMLFKIMIFSHVWFIKMESKSLRIFLLVFSILELQKNNRFQFSSKLKKQEMPLLLLILSSYCSDPIKSLSRRYHLMNLLKCVLFCISAILVSHHKPTNKFILCNNYLLNQIVRLIFLFW